MIISNNQNLTQFGCVECNIKNLSFLNNENLIGIGLDIHGAAVEIFELVNSDNLTQLSFSLNTNLVSLKIRNSEITALDVSKNTDLTTLDVTGSPLTCIKVNQNQFDNIPTGWVKDAEDTYSLTCE